SSDLGFLREVQRLPARRRTEWRTREAALDLLQKAGFDAAKASAVITTDEQGRVNKQTLMDVANALNRWELEQLQAQGLRLQNLYEASTDRKSTRLNSSHVKISYAVFCLKKK